MLAEPSGMLGAICESSSESGPDSPPATIREARISQGELHGAPSCDISMPMTGEREFRVTGRLSDDAPDTVNLRLRIQQQDGELCPQPCPYPHSSGPVQASDMPAVCCGSAGTSDPAAHLTAPGAGAGTPGLCMNSSDDCPSLGCEHQRPQEQRCPC